LKGKNTRRKKDYISGMGDHNAHAPERRGSYAWKKYKRNWREFSAEELPGRYEESLRLFYNSGKVHERTQKTYLLRKILREMGKERAWGHLTKRRGNRLNPAGRGGIKAEYFFYKAHEGGQTCSLRLLV